MTQDLQTPADYLDNEAAYLAHVEALRHARWPSSVPREPRHLASIKPLPACVRDWAQQQPDKAAVMFYGRALSWSELDRLSDRFATLLIGLGCRPGDRVGAFLPNCPQFHVVFLGVLKAGCVHVPINPMFTETELRFELQDAEVQVLVAHDQLLPLVERVLPDSTVQHLYATSFLDALPPEPVGHLPPGLTQERVRSDRAHDLMPALAAITRLATLPAPSLDAPAALNYTGGTTGMPKGCVHSQRNMLYTATIMSSISADIGADDVVVNYWPVFWVAGQDVGILLPLFTGATCVLMARWDPVGFIDTVERYRASVAFMLVDNAVQVLEHPQAQPGRLGSLRETMVASFVKKLNPTYRERWLAMTGATLREAAWGMTETHSFDTFTRGFQHDNTDLKARQVFCGLAVPGTRFKILEFGTERLLPLGEEGELCVSSPSLFKGYWKKPEATAEAIRDGWLRTGDLGMIAPDGCVHFFGRRKEMLKVKGMSVFPSEIEAVLGQHPAVTGSGVIGREDDDRGQVPVAFITVQDGAVTPQDISAFCRERLAVYKLPEVRIVAALPMTATGKVRKDKLVDLLAG